HHSDRLHVGVADGRADELEAELEEVLAERVGLLGLRRDLVAAIDAGASADEAPDIGVEAAELLLHREELLCIGDRAVELEAVADQALVFHKAIDARRTEARHLG